MAESREAKRWSTDRRLRRMTYSHSHGSDMNTIITNRDRWQSRTETTQQWHKEGCGDEDDDDSSTFHEIIGSLISLIQ